jgi:hypothetical protein
MVTENTPSHETSSRFPFNVAPALPAKALTRREYARASFEPQLSLTWSEMGKNRNAFPVLGCAET